MCGIAAAGLALSAISTVAGMGGTVMSATNQSKSAKAQAEVQMQQAKNQQILAEQQAQNEIAKGIAEENRHRRQASKQQGELASMLSASGFQMDSGSMLGILTDSAEEAQYDSNIILNNAEQAAWGHLVNANNAGNSYAAFEAAKANSGVDGLALGLNMGSTLLGGAGTMADRYYRYTQSKAPDSSGGLSSVYDMALKNNPFETKKISFAGSKYGN